jgi:hypothetical protein
MLFCWNAVNEPGLVSIWWTAPMAVGSGERLCENSFFNHPIHLLDSPKFAISKI